MWWTGTVHRFQEVGQSSLLCLWGGVVLEISSPAIEVPAPSLMQRAQSGALDVTLLPPTEQGMLTCLLTSSWVVSSTSVVYLTPKILQLDVVSPELNYAVLKIVARVATLEIHLRESAALPCLHATRVCDAPRLQVGSLSRTRLRNRFNVLVSRSIND